MLLPTDPPMLAGIERHGGNGLTRSNEPARCLYPHPAIFLPATAAVAALSTLTLPWAAAVASTVLGALMIAGAEIDARTYLLPDLVTLGALACGILAAALLDPHAPWNATAAATARAAGTAGAIALLRAAYARLRVREGLGFGDVKLAAAVGAWLPLASVPLCFALASVAGLIAVLIARRRGHPIAAATALPFGAFLCPALWLAFCASRIAAA
jgi:leader peptidase (prepilin peptidase)/N-methyltransferase